MFLISTRIALVPTIGWGARTIPHAPGRHGVAFLSFFPYLHKTTSLCRRVPCSPRSQIHLKLKFKSIASILQFLNFFRSSISAPSSPGFKPDSHDDPPRSRAAGGRRWAREAAQNGVLGRPRDRKVSAPSRRPPLSNRPTLFTSPYSNFRPGLMSRGGLVPSQLPPAGGRRWAHEATQNGVLGRPQDRRVFAPSCRPPLSDRPTLSTFPYSNFRPGLMSSGGLVPSQLPPVESRPRRFPSASCPVVRPSLLP